MSYKTLISSSELNESIGNPEWAIIDCRYWLDDTEQGRRDYISSHIPGAVYAHMDEHLAAEVIPGVTGRHPLPDIESFSKTLSNWGINSKTQVIAYDDRGGAMASRLWWMLRWLGHDTVAVLDGGWQDWLMGGYATVSGEENRDYREFNPQPNHNLMAGMELVIDNLSSSEFILIDARTNERYRGEVEPIDTVAGHIPGAINLPYLDNLTDEGFFLSKKKLREKYKQVIGDTLAYKVIFYCGSGVTSAHNILAMSHARLGNALIYIGSWSEWICEPNRPIHTSK
jgi:thiosulfate/3-mercaptopyruvate sulfurtransferase